MKLNYNYFLQRRNLTTKKIILSNGITTSVQFLELLESLKVTPPCKEDMDSFFPGEKSETKKKTVYTQKVEKDDKKETKVPPKKTSPGKSTPGRARTKKVSSSDPASRTSSIRKKKSSK